MTSRGREVHGRESIVYIHFVNKIDAHTRWLPTTNGKLKDCPYATTRWNFTLVSTPTLRSTNKCAIPTRTTRGLNYTYSYLRSTNKQIEKKKTKKEEARSLAAPAPAAFL